MVLFSSVFFLFPVKRGEDDAESLEQANLKWYRLRERELAAEDNPALREDIQLRLLEDEPGIADPEANETNTLPAQSALTGSRFPGWLLLPLIALGSALLYYFLGAAPDVQIAERLENFNEATAPDDVEKLIADIEVRAQQRPDNLHYVALLGRYFMAQENYPRAEEVYDTLLASAPEDAQALAYAAQAEYLSRGRKLTDRARLRAEQALAANPHQRTALGLLGMASFEQEQYRAAIAYWQRLLATETPNSEGARMIEGVIATAQQNLGGATAVPEQVAAQGGAGVTVRVELPAGSAINPTDTVFVLARNATSGSRMPIAVQRLRGDQVPITLRLDDSNSMAGQKLSATESVIVAVQVSPQGRPGEAAATWLGQVGPLAPSQSTEPLLITLQQKTP